MPPFTQICLRRREPLKNSKRELLRFTQIRLTHGTCSYIKNLSSYLLSFTKKTQPLVDIDTRQQEATADFDKRWDALEIPGWEDVDPKSQANGNENMGIWCGACMCIFVQKYFCRH